MKKSSIITVYLSSLFLASPTIAAGDETQARMSVGDVVAITLESSPDIQLQQLGTDRAKAGVRIASGAFNVKAKAGLSRTQTNTTSLDVNGLTPEDRALLPPGTENSTVRMNSNNLSMGLSKSFRNGIVSDLSAVTRQTDPDFTHRLFLDTSKTSVKFTLKIPLLQGAGQVSAAAGETAARLEHEATLADFQHAVSSTVLKSITAFWDYASASWYLSRVNDSKQRVQAWIERAGRTNDGLQGYLEDKKGKLIDARQALEQAKIALSNAMGIPTEQLTPMGMPTIGNFPLEWDAALEMFSNEALLAAWLHEAEEKRLDLKAAHLRQEISKVYLEKARKDKLPQLDLTVGAGYNGFSQYTHLSNVVDSYYQNIPDMDYTVGLSFSYPLGNDVAEGRFDQSQVDYQKKRIDTAEKIRSIRLDVQNQFSNVYGRMQKNVQSLKTLESYEKALENLAKDGDIVKDLAKLITIMELEDKYLQAQGEGARALSDLANAIAKARFATGTLIAMDESNGEINLQELRKLPGQ